MKRIIMMVLRNLYLVPYMLVRLFRYSSHMEKYSLEQRYELIRFIVRRAVHSGNVKLIITGQENLPKKDGFILYPNHQGMFDPLAVIQACDRPLRVVVKKELENTPILKQALKIIHAQFIDRDDIRQSMGVILNMTKEVKEGNNYLIYAEGTRSRKGNELLEFKGGSFKAATKAKAPIVPVALIDTYKLFDTGSIRQATAQVHILPSLYYEEYQDMKGTELAAEVQRRIAEKIRECESAADK